jgi:hypothetical protein
LSLFKSMYLPVISEITPVFLTATLINIFHRIGIVTTGWLGFSSSNGRDSFLFASIFRPFWSLLRRLFSVYPEGYVGRGVTEVWSYMYAVLYNFKVWGLINDHRHLCLSFALFFTLKCKIILNV